MTRHYTEEHYNINTNKIEKIADWSFSTYPGNNEILTVCKNGKAKTVKVAENPDYVYKMAKHTKTVSAKNGASGLFSWLDDALYSHFMECIAWKILNFCFDECIPA